MMTVTTWSAGSIGFVKERPKQRRDACQGKETGRPPHFVAGGSPIVRVTACRSSTQASNVVMLGVPEQGGGKERFDPVLSGPA